MTDWPVKTLGDVCEVIAGQSPEGKFYNKEGKGVPFYQGKKDFAERVLGSPTTWTSEVTKLARPGDILMSVRAPVGPVNLCPIDACIGRGLAAIRPSSKTDTDFIYYYLESIQSEIAGTEGAVFASINKAQIAGLRCPVPPLEEQKRIVALLDAATAHIVEQKELRSRQSMLETEIHSAIVEELLAPVDGWNFRPLTEWCSEIGTGPFGSLVHKADYVEIGIPLVNPMNMKEGRILESGIRRVSQDKAIELNRYVLKTGDIVLGRRGEMGRCAVVRSEHDGWICGTGSFFLRPNEECNPDLLALWLSSRQGRSALSAISSGTTMDNLGNRELGLLQVAFPDRPTQDVIVSRSSALEVLVSKMQVQQQGRSLLLESLQQSILEAAFAGDL